MSEKPYTDAAQIVNPNPEEISCSRRDEVLLAMGLIRTEELLDVLGVSKKTLADKMRKYLPQLGVGKQKFYDIDEVRRAMKVAAMVQRACGDDDGDEEA